MFKFSPFNWASSFVLSKFLQPYFKKIDNKQVDVGFWDGSLVLRDLEFKEDLLLQHDIDIEIVKSFISEIKITIPWKQIKQKPITITLTGVKLVLSNFINVTNQKREALQTQQQLLKIDSLKKFDEAVVKDEKSGMNGSGNEGGFLMDFFKQLTDNFILEINDLEIVYVYHINNFEIVKFGFNIDQLIVSSVGDIEQKKKKENQHINSLQKNIIVKNFSLIFEFYDNFQIVSQLYKFDDLQEENFIKTSHTKAEQFLNKFRQDNKEFMQNLPNEEQDDERQNGQQKFYILKKLDIFVLIKVKFQQGREIEVDVRTSPILIFLKQRQIRLLIRALQDLLNHRPDRPKHRPPQGSKQWWKYTIKRIIEEEHIVIKAKKYQMASYLGAERYRYLYSRKMLKSPKVKKSDQDVLDAYESKNSLTQIIMLRSIAIDKIIQMRNILQSLNPSWQESRRQAKQWFAEFDSDFNLEHAANIKFNSSVIQASIQGSKPEDIEDNKSQNRLSIIVVLSQVIILVQENEMLQQLKSLHNQVNIFKKELQNKHQLRDQVLDHIRVNFLNKMSQLNQAQGNQRLKGQFSNSINDIDDWKVNQFMNGQHKILMQLEINSIKFEYITHGESQQLFKGSVKDIQLNDMNKVNVHYKRILELPEGFKILYSSEQIQQKKRILEVDEMNKVVQVHLDVQLGPVNMTLSKPLFERFKSLISLVFFDPNEYQVKKSSDLEQLNNQQNSYFNQFLVQNRRVQTETNLSLRIQSINVYMPLMYHRQSEMCLCHIKVLRFFKREHDNNMVNVYNLDSEEIQMIEEHVKGNVNEFIKGLNKNKKIEKVSNLNQQDSQDAYYTLQPLFITLECLRVAFVNSYDWEQKENLFLIEYNKLKGGQSINSQTDNGIETIFETLPIKLRMEQIVTRLQVGYVDSKKRNFKKLIYPKTNKMFLELPFMNINLSIKHLYLIQQIMEIWSTKGYDFFDILGTSAELEHNRDKHQNNMFNQKQKSTQRPVSHQIEMQSQIVEYLKEHVMSQVEVSLEGLLFSLTVNTMEKLNLWSYFASDYDGKVPVQQATPVGQLIIDADPKKERENCVRAKMFHENNILQIYLDKMLYCKEDTYFESIQNLAIQEFLIRNISCHDFNIRAPLKMMCSNMLSQSDYSQSEWYRKQKELMKQQQSRQKISTQTSQHLGTIKLKPIIDNTDDDILGDQLLNVMNDISRISPIQMKSPKANIQSPLIFHSPGMMDRVIEPDERNPEAVLQEIFAFEPFIKDFWMCGETENTTKICKKCHFKNQPNQRLILNFQKREESTPDFYMFQMTRYNVPYLNSDSLHQHNQKTKPQTELSVEIQSLNFVMDPNIVRQVKMIIDIGGKTAFLQKQQFEIWMKTTGFWPDFHEDWGSTKIPNQINKDQSTTTPDSSLTTLKIEVKVKAMTILCAHKNENIFLFNMRNIFFEMSSSKLKNVMTFSAYGLSLYDTSQKTGNHPQIITNLLMDKENSLVCEIRMYNDENLIRIQKYQTYCGVRLQDCLIVFLKRNTNEIQSYIRNIAISSFYSVVTQADIDFIKSMQDVYLMKNLHVVKQLEFYDQERLKKESDDKSNLLKQQKHNQEEPKPSLFRFSLAALDCQVIGYRNSISDDALYISFSKAGYWFTGQWGKDYDSLIRTGLFSEELEGIQVEQQKISTKPIQKSQMYVDTSTVKRSTNTQQYGTSEMSPTSHQINIMQFNGDIPEEIIYYQAVNDDVKLKEHLADKIDTDTFYSVEGDTREKHKLLDCYQIVNLWDLEIRTCPGQDQDTILLKCPKGKISLEVLIIFEDKEFKSSLSQKYYPLTQTNPMKIVVNLPEAKIYAYDLDYCTLVKFFQENLGEQAQTVVSSAGPWDFKNKNIWMSLEVNLGRALAKFFKGKREDINDYIHLNKLDLHRHSNNLQSNQSFRKKMFLYKNPASIALIKLKSVNYRFFMRENGGKLMKLLIQKINIADFRLDSLLQDNKWVLFRMQEDQFRGEDDANSENANDFEDESEDEWKSEIESEDDDIKKNTKTTEVSPDQQKTTKKKSNKVSFKEPKEEEKESFTIINEINLNNPSGTNNDANKQDQDMLLFSPTKNNQSQEIRIGDGTNILQNKSDTQFKCDQVSVHEQPKVNKTTLTKWSRFKKLCRRVFCCGREKTPALDQKEDDDILQQDDGLLNQAQFIEPTSSPDRPPSLQEHPKKEFPYRTWKNYRIQQTLPVTIKNDPNDLDDDDGQVSDFKLNFYSEPDGEKLIKILVENKNLLVIVDFLVEIVEFFRTPYNGSDVQPYQLSPKFNNFPPMMIEIFVQNVWAIIPGDLINMKSQSLALLVDVIYSQEWSGDNWYGPGMCEKKLDLKLKKTFIFVSDTVMKTHKKIKVPIHQKGVKFQEELYYHNQSQNQFRSLLEPFRLSLTTKYSLDFWRKVIDPYFEQPTIFVDNTQEAYPYYEDLLKDKKKMEDFQSQNHLTLKLVNNKKLKNNFSISIRDIAQVGKILGNVGKTSINKIKIQVPYVMTRKAQPEQNFVDNCYGTKRISIKSLRLQIQKNKEGVKVGIIALQQLKMKNVTLDSKYKLYLCSKIQLNYFNKRKLDFEPVLEPWKFKLTIDNHQDKDQQQVQRDVQKIKLTNYIEKSVNGMEIPFYLKDHTNSLNFNITTGLVETGMEAFKIYKEEMDDGEPYKIFNRSGYPLELRDVKKDSSLRRLSVNDAIEWQGWRDLYFQDGVRRSQREGGQQMYLNVMVLKKEVIQDQLLNNIEEDLNEDEAMSPATINPHLKFEDVDVQLNSNILITTNINLAQSMQVMNKIQSPQHYDGSIFAHQKDRIINLSRSTQSTNFTRKKAVISATPKKFYRNEISNYKLIKYVSLDYVGKRFYPLEKIHRNELQLQDRVTKGNALDVFLKQNIDKLTGAFLTNRKINEDGNVQLLVNVNINPQNGSKEISVSSSVKFYNYLEIPIEVGFLANGQSKESARICIDSKQIYAVPLEFLENKTEVRFLPTQKGNHQQKQQIFSEFEYRYYQLDHLICDSALVSDFDVDEDNTVSEVLQQADTYATLNDQYPIKVIKNEFKDIKEPLVYKVDHQINSTKNMAKSSSKNFYFIMSCVKVKYHSTNQKKAYISYAGIQSQKYNEIEEDITTCYETYLIFYPVFKLTNATIRRINIYYGISSSSEKQREKQREKQQSSTRQQDGHEYLDKSTVKPGDSFSCYKLGFSEDIIICLSLAGFEKSIEMKIFKRWFQFGEKKPKFEICFKREHQSKQQLYLSAQMNTLSQKTREIVIYCPYLIMNETDQSIMYREHGYAQDIISIDDVQVQRNNQKGFKARGQQTKNKQVKSQENQDLNLEYDEINQLGFDKEKEVDKNRIEEDLKNLHMFSTSSNMKKIQIALQDINEYNKAPSIITTWSKPISLQNVDGVHAVVGSTEVFKKNLLETRQYNQTHLKLNNNKSKDKGDENEQIRQKDKNTLSWKGKFEFAMKIITAPGLFYRSKLIILAPRYIVYNEGPHPIVMAQVDTEFQEENLLRVKPKDWKYFYWSNEQKKDHVTISYYELSTGQVTGWSGQFLINKVCEIALKLKNPGSSAFGRQNKQPFNTVYSLQKINISLIDESGVLLIRFVHEDPIIPPYYIENITKYEIQFKQNNAQSYGKRSVLESDEEQRDNNNGVHNVVVTHNKYFEEDKAQTLSIAAGGDVYTFLQPGERVAFTWDHWIDDNDHILKVEIEGISKDYHIDKIQDFQPIILPSSLRRKTNKNYLYKQGMLSLKEYDKFVDKYCVLNVLNQKLKIYTIDKTSRQVFSLKGGKLDETKNNEFMLVVEPKKITSRTLNFQARNQDELNKWIDFFWRAILINKPDMVELKIEPMNSTKVLSFYIMKQQEEQTYQQNKLKATQGDSISGMSFIMRQQVEEDDQFLRSNFQKLVIRTYQLSISNCIGISLIDSTPKEIIQICFRDVQLSYTTSDEQIKDEGNQLLQDNDNEPPNEDQKVNGTQLSQISTQYLSMVDKSFIRLKKEYLNLTVDLVIINNQLQQAQFPVLLAPNKKKIYGEQQPFLMVSLFWKDQNKESTKKVKQVVPSQPQVAPKISYIHTFTVFMDTLEIRLDDYILEAILNLVSQLKLLVVNGENQVQNDINLLQFDFRSLQAKLEESLTDLKQQTLSQKYIKNLILEPIDICFTFRSSPGHSMMNSTTKNYITDLGLTMASIDSAKIKLNSLKIQHIFGSSNEIISRITKHYSRQFLSQLYKLFGSFELLGNPVSLIENLGTGVIDMFYEPLYALVKGQSGLKVGEKFVSGAVSLIGHSIQGVVQTVNKILGTIMKILANITFDKKYIQQRQNKLNRTIKNFKEGLVIGFKNFGSILASALFGIFERPFNGITVNGFLGFLLGLYQGVMGVIIKPTVGIYDLLTTIIDGVKNTAVYEEHIMDTRFRPPRIFGENNLLIPFDFIPAIGTDILKKFKMNTIDSETILFFDQIQLNPEKKRSDVAEIVLTDIRLIYVVNHSSIHYEKIMIYKLQSVKYLKGRLVFQFHTPVRRNICGKSYYIYLPYESSTKATRLMNKMQEAFQEKYEYIKFSNPEDFKNTLKK